MNATPTANQEDTMNIIDHLKSIGERQGDTMKRRDRALVDKLNQEKWDVIKRASVVIGEVKAYEIYTESYRQANGFYN